jgi:rRNA-processing protein FCF1
MKVIMDADCLIKLTKSNLKETVCKHFSLVIPFPVKNEVLDNAGDLPDAVIIKENIDKKLLLVSKALISDLKGENAVLSLYRQGKFDAVCSDDKKFIKKLRLLDVPYITPAVFIVILLKKGILTAKSASERLEDLSPFVSDDEYHTVKLVLENWRLQ